MKCDIKDPFCAMELGEGGELMMKLESGIPAASAANLEILTI